MDRNQQSGSTSESSSGPSPQTQAPSIQMPKRGGAFKGIENKFTGNPTKGKGSLNEPIFSCRGKSNFHLQLAPSYKSSTGNSPFVMGWGLSLPSISQKIDKGVLPYFDHKGSASCGIPEALYTRAKMNRK